MSRACPACGQPLDDDVRFCTGCGRAVSAPQPNRRPTRRRTVIGAAGAAIVLALGGAWLLRDGGASKAADGGWAFSSTEDGIQAIFARTGGEPLFRLSCNLDDGTLWMNSQALPAEEVEKRAATRHALDLTLSGGGGRQAIEGYVTRAPEGASTSWDVTYTPELLALLGASDLALAGPAIAVKGGAPALAEFVRACPAPASLPADGWGTLTSRADGYRLDLPRSLFRLVAGDRGGRRYVSESGNAELVVGAQANALDQTLMEAARADTLAVPRLDRETLRVENARTIVLSGPAGGRTVYFKARATCDNATFAWFRLSYDAAARADFDPVVTRMAKSFDATAMPDGTPICP